MLLDRLGFPISSIGNGETELPRSMGWAVTGRAGRRAHLRYRPARLERRRRELKSRAPDSGEAGNPLFSSASSSTSASAPPPQRADRYRFRTSQRNSFRGLGRGFAGPAGTRRLEVIPYRRRRRIPFAEPGQMRRELSLRGVWRSRNQPGEILSPSIHQDALSSRRDAENEVLTTCLCKGCVGGHAIRRQG